LVAAVGYTAQAIEANRRYQKTPQNNPQKDKKPT